MPAALRSVFGAWTLAVAAWALAGTAGGQQVGSIVAWGWNYAGQCNVPAPNSGFVAVAGGYGNSLGLKANGSIVAWGDNGFGQCDVPAPNSGFVAVTGGYTHSLGLKADGSIVAWGTNWNGERNVPAPNSGFVAAAAGWCHSLGLKADGSIVAWGYDQYGECNVPAPNSGFVAVAAGEYHSLGLKADGSVVAWGYNAQGQCDVPAPNTGFVAVAGAYGHSLGLKANGSIVVWGYNYNGNIPPPNSGFVGVAAGYIHSLGLKADGSIVAWGWNNAGDCNVPAPNSGFFALAAGVNHSLAIKNCGGGVGPAITQQPIGGATFCSVGSASFSVAADGTAPLSWRWRKDGIDLTNGGNISGATTATLTINPIRPGDAATYDCVVSNTCGRATSDGAVVTVEVAPPVIPSQPSNQSACLGGSAGFEVAGLDDPGPAICQWRRGTTNLTDGGHISGARTPWLTIHPVGLGDAATDYNCVVTNTCGDTVSNNATLTVDVAGPSITHHPGNWSTSCDGSASFTVGASSGSAPKYQWRRGTVNLTDGGNISGVTTTTLTISPVHLSDAASDYNCVVTNGCSSAASAPATLTVSGGAAPSITGQPADWSTGCGGSASFTVGASGGPAPTYQWRRGTANLTDGDNISGATTATLTINPAYLGDAASDYNCVVANGCGNTTSMNASLTVVGAAPSITGQPSGQEACSGDSASFTVAGSGTPAPAYQWRKGTTDLTDGGNISGATTATLTVDPVGPGDAATYNCVVTNACGSTSSNSARLTVDVAPPLIARQPIDRAACLGGSAGFTLAVGDEPWPGICQWRRGTTNLTDGGNISGSATAWLTINPVGVGDAATDYNCVVTNACGDTISNSATLTVNVVAPSITGQPSNQVAYSGGVASFVVAVSDTTAPTYLWRKGTTNLTDGGNISGARTATLTINPVGSGDAASNYNCFVNSGCGSTASSNATLTVSGAVPSITNQPTDRVACSGGSASFSVSVSGAPAPTYQWRKGTNNLTNDGNISGATTWMLTIYPVGSGDAASNYNCVVTNSCGSTTSRNARLTVSAATPSIVYQPSNQTMCLGGSASFTAVASGGGTALTYQWRRGTENLINGGNITGAATSTLTINPVGSSDGASDYNCVATNACGHATSNNAALTLDGAAPSITDPPSNQAGCLGGSAQFTVTATGATSYQWRMGATNLTNGGKISGATTATLTLNPVGTGDAAPNYNCVVTNGCGSTTSDNAALTVDATALSITDQPSDQAACAGGAASFTVAASGTLAPTYQWRKGTANLPDGGSIFGATTATLTIYPVGSGDAAPNYNCVVGNGLCNTTSNNATLTVNIAVPSITDQPSNQAACLGGSTSFAVTASGASEPTYQWRKGTTELTDGGNVFDATTATLTINPVGIGDAAADYNCVVTNVCGDTTSDDATLTVIVTAALSITDQPSDQAACLGGWANFTVAASDTPAPTYQWRKGTTNLTNGGNISGTTTARLTINPVGAGDAATNYNCVVSDGCGNTTSANATLTLDGAAPSITDPPSNEGVCLGGSASFTVIASGTPAPTYQWRRGPINVVDGGNISGATTATLTINPAGLADSRPDYNVIVSNACGAGSSFVSLTVGTGPVFDVQPAAQRGRVGAGTTFSVAATAIGAGSYAWRKDGNTLANGGNIAGATTAMLSINPITKGDAGAYDVVVTDDCGVATSSAATLWLAGDVNCDGVISYADINPFVLALSGPNEYHAVYPSCDWNSADVDGNGQVSYADIDPFVALLGGK